MGQRRGGYIYEADRDASEILANFPGVLLGSYWGLIGVLLGSYWGLIGVLLGSYWGLIGVLLGSYWGLIGVLLGSYMINYDKVSQNRERMG